MAIDRDAISRQLFEGKQPVAHGQVNPLDRYYSEDFTKYPFDPAAAVKLLEEAGWKELRGGIRHDASGRRLSLEFQSTAGNRTRELVQQVLQAQWQKAGIEVRINNQPARVLFGSTMRERQFPAMAMFAWLSAPENIPRTIMHSTMIPTPENGFSGQNYVGFSNPEADKLIDDLEVTCKEDEATAAVDPLAADLRRATALPAPLFPVGQLHHAALAGGRQADRPPVRVEPVGRAVAVEAVIAAGIDAAASSPYGCSRRWSSCWSCRS